MKKIMSITGILLVLILTIGSGLVGATDYPTKPITIINPNPPGGGHDVIGRAFASVAEKHLGQPMVVINKPGASGMIGMLAVAQAAPDGYTIGLDSTTTTNALEWEIANGRKPSFTRNDILPVGCITINVPLVVVPYNSPWKTLSDLIRDCKAKPDFYAFCSGGLYGGSHLPAEVLMKATGIKARHVPHKGGGPCLSALVGEHVHFATQWPATSIPLARGKKLRILAVQDDRRMKSIPDIPTVKELGIDAEWGQWLGFSVPQNIPAPILERLKGVVKKVAEDESFIKIVEGQGAEVYYMSSEDVIKYCEKESKEVAKVYKHLLEEKK
ncbi:MAG: tripartite tricarboxylate transporter substrate binding protein [Thermodesulfobacteriota bacterium]|nr:tripartite tricarboxylate transporter substrate binding protein [Thermodesulfobacteriota bacterium]